VTRTVVSIVGDLLTSSRIEATARQLGVAHLSAAPRQALDLLRRSPADLVLVDLEAPGDPEEVIRALKQDPSTRSIPVIGFYPHVRNALRESALAAGADQVLPRSAFVRRLADLLRGGTVPPGPSD
jgi:CheY-like chemotaxis protein